MLEPTMSESPESKTLDQIPTGHRVEVLDVAGNDAVARRLDDLGLRRGVPIRVIRKAPLGDPTVFELCGYQLCLRRSESARVRVLDRPMPDLEDGHEAGGKTPSDPSAAHPG